MRLARALGLLALVASGAGAGAAPATGGAGGAAAGATDAAGEIATARAEALQALQDPGAAADAWARASRAAERALRRLSPAWADAVDAGGDPGAAAARVETTGAEALYWLALASWEGARPRGFAALLSVKDFALRSMERVAVLDERVDCGGPHRALGSWRAALPAAVGGGAAPARAHFARAHALGPSCPWNRVQEAATLTVLLQDRKRFETLLGEVLAAPPTGPSASPPADPEVVRQGEVDEAARRAARDLLARRDRLFR